MRRSARSRWAAGGVSIAVNGLLILAVARIGAAVPSQAWVEPPAMEALLVSVRGAQTPSPAGPAQAAVPSPPAPAPAPPPPPKAPVESRVLEAAQPLLVADAAAAASTAAASVMPAKPAPPAPAPQAGSAQGLAVPAPNGASNDYASRLRAWLEAHKSYPRRSRMRREEGVVQIHFAVDRRGRLLAGDVIRSSGYAALDLEAMAMLDRADPFPSAPHGMRGERIEVSTPVEFYLQR